MIAQAQHNPSSNNGTPPLKDFNSDVSSCRSDSPTHALELELMHRWSTVTYISVSTPILDDFAVWKCSVPRAALQYDFLLNGVFAVSALELAHSLGPSESDKYISAAFEFQDRAFQSYQAHLRNNTPESHEALLYFSILLVVLAIAIPPIPSMPPELDNKVQRMIGHFELVRGVGVVITNQLHRYTKERLREDPLFKNVKTLDQLPRIPVDPSTETALGSLALLNESRSASSPTGSSDARYKSLVIQGSCKKALFWLEECFSICNNDTYRTWALAWIAMPGDDYIKAVKEKDHVALLILMCWGVLIEPMGNDLWYAEGFGKSLVEEISGSIPVDTDPLTQEIVGWARQELFAGSQGTAA